METPTLAFQHLLTKAVSVASCWEGVIAGTIGLDGEYHPPRFVGVSAGEIDAIAGDPVLGCNRDATANQTILNGKLEGIEWHFAYLKPKILSSRCSKLEVFPEKVYPL